MINQRTQVTLAMLVACSLSTPLIAGEKPKHTVVLFPVYTIDYHLNPKQMVQFGGFKLSTSVPLDENLTLHSSDISKCIPVFAQSECPVGSIKSKGMINVGVTYHY
jgi:hypothetical protein